MKEEIGSQERILDFLIVNFLCFFWVYKLFNRIEQWNCQ